MKRIAPILLFVSALLSFTGCKKDTAPDITCQLATYQDLYGISTFTYNAQGRVTDFNNAGSTNHITYTGLTGIYTNTQTADTSQHSYSNLSFNASGRLTAMNETVIISGDTYYYTYTYTYNAEGYMVLCEQSLEDLTNPYENYRKDSLVYQNGNLIAKYTFQSNTGTNYTLNRYILISYTTLENKLGYYVWSFVEEPTSMLSGFTFLYHLYGNTSKNLPLETVYYEANGTIAYRYNYSFLLNEYGYPTDESIVRSVASPSTENRTFTYTCK